MVVCLKLAGSCGVVLCPHTLTCDVSSSKAVLCFARVMGKNQSRRVGASVAGLAPASSCRSVPSEWDVPWLSSWPYHGIDHHGTALVASSGYQLDQPEKAASVSRKHAVSIADLTPNKKAEQALRRQRGPELS